MEKFQEHEKILLKAFGWEQTFKNMENKRCLIWQYCPSYIGIRVPYNEITQKEKSPLRGRRNQNMTHRGMFACSTLIFQEKSSNILHYGAPMWNCS